MRWRTIFFITILFSIAANAFGQKKVVDTAGKTKALAAADSSALKNKKKKEVYCDTCFSPKKATIRSALIPGWGQVYNKQVWKVPLVYGVLGVTAGIFIVNIREYNGLRAAYKLKLDTIPSNDNQIPARYSVLSANSMKFYRDEYRQSVDLSVLVFLIGWGLNVVDATVSAHLKQFDVSDDLSLKIKPVLQVNGQAGLSFVFGLKNSKGKLKDMDKILNAR